MAETRLPTRSTPVHLNLGEIAEMQILIEKGELPRNALKAHYDAEDAAVHGFDAKKDRKGKRMQQGIGAPGYETANHFAALKKAERQGLEEPGTYKRMVAEIWKRDPKRAAALGLPKVVEEKK